MAHPSTFSIVASDPETGECGVAVASKFLSVGAVVPWAQAGVGAVATQSYANTTYGPAGLTLMAQGYEAQNALDGLLAADRDREQRQVGIVDVRGGSATFTGSGCFEWAGGRTGRYYAAQGNILAGAAVVDAMADTFEKSSGWLPARLLEALAAGERAGGDRRGRQSAALLVVRERGGYGGFNDRAVDLRVDDHPAPIHDLARLLNMNELYFQPTRSEDIVPVNDQIVATVRAVLQRAGNADIQPEGPYDAATQSALEALYRRENLEERWRDGAEIDAVALRFLTTQYPSGA